MKVFSKASLLSLVSLRHRNDIDVKTFSVISLFFDVIPAFFYNFAIWSIRPCAKTRTAICMRPSAKREKQKTIYKQWNIISGK